MMPPIALAFSGSVPLHSPIGALRVSLVPYVALVALVVLMAAPVTAQTVAASFEELRFKVKPGDTVYVTDDSGKSEQVARVLDLTSSSLAVSIDGVRRDLLESSVTRIRQRLPDSRKNGALIGFLVGAAITTGGAKAMASPPGSCTGGCVAVNVLFGGGVGALVGLGVDALIQGRKDIYVRGSAAPPGIVVLNPFVLSQAKGLSLSLRF